MQKLLLLLAMLACSAALMAQPRLMPFQANARTAGHNAKAPFPFYHDFSKANGLADTAYWAHGGGVFVNDAFGKDAPTAGVATFDGFDANGQPYNFIAPSAMGYADTLTSLPIDLSAGVAPADSVVLSFYWQARGWGEQPNKNDSLYLFFLNSAGNWVRQWAIGGIDTLTPFNKQEIVLKNSTYFHANFQFRFLNFARLSGPYDTWNLDYVYLNTRKNARLPDRGIVRDLAFVGGKYAQLKGYTQMPLSQYRDNLLQDTLKARLRNALGSTLGDNATHLMKTSLYANEQLVWQALDTAQSFNSSGFPSSNGTINIPLNEVVEVKVRSRPFASKLTGADSALLVQEFFLANNAEDLNGVYTKANDTIAQRTLLHNAFAYDDGSAEFGWGINKKFGRVAYQFEAFSNWKINAIDLHIAKLGRKIEQGGFRLGIWQHADTLNNANDLILLQPVYFTLSYADSMNQFQRFYLGTDVNIPQGKFYVVLEQLTDVMLPIGFDALNNTTDKIFINLGGTRWQPLGNTFYGSLLMRPVYEKQEVTALPDDGWRAQPLLYPNPATTEIAWGPEVTKIEIYSLAGQLLLATPTAENGRLQVGHLPKGMYLAHLYTSKGIKIEKLITH